MTCLYFNAFVIINQPARDTRNNDYDGDVYKTGLVEPKVINRVGQKDPFLRFECIVKFRHPGPLKRYVRNTPDRDAPTRTDAIL